MVKKELIQQYYEKNLAKMTRTCGRILQYRQLSCVGNAWNSRIYGGLIVNSMISKYFLFAVLCFPLFWKFSLLFGIATSFKRNLHLFPVELANFREVLCFSCHSFVRELDPYLTMVLNNIFLNELNILVRITSKKWMYLQKWIVNFLYLLSILVYTERQEPQGALIAHLSTMNTSVKS